MTPEQYQRVKQILQAAVEQDAGERAAFLDRACAGDEELRRRVEMLLASDDSMGEFLSEPLAAVAAAPEHPAEFLAGRRIGPYQIVREIGHGGMGTVYLAERLPGMKALLATFQQTLPGPRPACQTFPSTGLLIFGMTCRTLGRAHGR